MKSIFEGTESMKGKELEILRKTASRLISETPTKLKGENKMKEKIKKLVMSYFEAIVPDDDWKNMLSGLEKMAEKETNELIGIFEVERILSNSGKLKNQEIWNISKEIIDSMKKLNEMKDEDRKKILWDDLQDMWLDYLEEKINGGYDDENK